MKKIFLLSAFFICSFSLYAQFNHQIYFQTGIYHNQIIRFSSVEGASTYDHQNSFSLGIGYRYNFNNRVSLKTVVNWQNSLLTSNNISTTGELIREDISLETINLPILFGYQLNKYFFIDAGPVIHFDTSNEPGAYVDSQNGLGFSLGIGIQYNFSAFTIFGKPNIQMLSLLPFNPENHPERLLSTGFIFGVGYNF